MLTNDENYLVMLNLIHYHPTGWVSAKGHEHEPAGMSFRANVRNLQPSNTNHKVVDADLPAKILEIPRVRWE